MDLPAKAVFPPWGWPSEHMDKGNDKEPPLRVERPTQKRLSRMRRKRRFAIMETGMESLP